MKKDKIIYWTTTGLVSAMMLFSAYSYLTNETMKNGFVHLGFPGYFRVELAIAKLFGALVLILPMLNAKVKEFAYFGFAITFISAFIAHLSSGDPMKIAISPVVFLAILAVSYLYFQKLHQTE
jgi:hypothetical protein